MQTPPPQSFPAVEATLKAAKNKDVTPKELPGFNQQHTSTPPHG